MTMMTASPKMTWSSRASHLQEEVRRYCLLRCMLSMKRRLQTTRAWKKVERYAHLGYTHLIHSSCVR
jgi:hypothetical protein